MLETLSSLLKKIKCQVLKLIYEMKSISKNTKSVICDIIPRIDYKNRCDVCGCIKENKLRLGSWKWFSHFVWTDQRNVKTQSLGGPREK